MAWLRTVSGLTRTATALLVASASTAFAQSDVAAQQVIGMEHQLSLPRNEIMVITPHDEVQKMIQWKPVPAFSAGGADHVLQSQPGLTTATVTSGVGFDGLGTTYPGFTLTGEPSDDNLSVGATQVVQWVNSMYAIFDKTGKLQFGPTNGNTPWQGSSIANGRCASDNSGDPIVLYDKQNQRWIFSQFAVSTTPYYQCIAVSTGSDARGPYNLYATNFGTNFNDYPKVGVFDGNYYFTFNLFAHGHTFAGADACVVPGAAVRSNASASMTCTNVGKSYGGLLPADVDGASGASGTTSAPPAGTSEYFLNFGSNSLHVWRMTASGSLSGPTSVPGVSAFSTACGGGTCIPQAGTSQQLDSLGDRLMYRLSYRNFGSYASLLVNHSVTGGSSNTGVRWYELRDGGSGPTVYQQGTYAPDSYYRWMGSMAQDKLGNIAVGYSVSGSTIDAGIRFASRAPGDTAGVLGSEQTLLISGNYQSGHSRWGDYTSMSVDPADDCTFWYTGQYMPSSGDFQWATHINSFKLGSCQ
ncbi:MAG: hypothetical protein NVSMB6_30170 [Burkholderiaceae bacterium]